MQENKTLTAAAAGTVTIGGDVTVNRMGFGAMRITGEGIWGPPADHAGAIAVLRRAVELDVNVIDTADSYGPNVSEELIAEALYPYPKGLVIATKGGWYRPGPGIWAHDASPAHLRDAVDGSLKRLRLERIDLYQLHIPDPAVAFEESIQTLAALRQEGKIRHIGLSNVTWEHVERARAIVPIVSVQNRYSIADHRESDHIVDNCEREGIIFFPWNPVIRSSAAGDAIQSVARAHAVTVHQIALAWLLRRSRTMLPIPGTTSIRHLEENIAAGAIRLTDDEFEALTRQPVLR
jgi:aryl-alcohol dehydrogenase-like predicted oxidoreductase